MKYRSEKIERVFSDSDNTYVYVVAEIGINHNGSLEEALRLVDASHEAGVDAVKFQKRKLTNIYSEKILNDPNSAEWSFDYLIPLLKDFELSEDDYRAIRDRCNELNLDLIVTPFDQESAEFVNTLGVVAFKIASADMVDLGLIKKCSSFGCPVIISTGMWDEEDIEKCVYYYKRMISNMPFYWQIQHIPALMSQ